MNGPIGIVVSANGSVYFADSSNSSVRMISGGNISTVAGMSGTSGAYAGEGGPATSATMNFTFHLSMDASGNLYVADEGNDMIHTF
jgi:streptogramin lyase